MTDKSNNHLLYVGTYISADQPSLHVVRFETESGMLTNLTSFTGIENPSFLVLHPNSRRLYAVSETGVASGGEMGSIWAFEIEADGVSLRPLNQQSTEGDWPCHIALDQTGRWLAVSNYGSGSAILYPILPDGRLGEKAAFVQHHGQGPNQSRQEGPHAHSATFTLDNRFMIVADLGIDRLMVYRFDSETGRLTLHQQVAAAPGAGPRHLAFHPTGRWLYVANELDSTVTVYGYDPDQRELTAGQSLATVPAGVDDNSVADIHLSPGAERLYVSNRGHNSVAIFAVSDGGSLTPLNFPKCGGKWPRNFAVGPDGRFIVVANRHTDDVVVLPSILGGQSLGEPVSRLTIPQPACIALG